MYILQLYGCHYLTWWVYGRPNAVQFGECSLSVIELLYNIIIDKYILVHIYI